MLPESLPPKLKRLPANLATLDHLRDRFDPTRRIPARGDKRRVMACNACNNLRGQIRQRMQPIEELRRRSQMHHRAAA